MAVILVRSGLPLYFYKCQHAALGKLQWNRMFRIIFPPSTFCQDKHRTTTFVMTRRVYSNVTFDHSYNRSSKDPIVLFRIRYTFTVVPVCVCEREWIIANWKTRQPYKFHNTSLNDATYGFRQVLHPANEGYYSFHKDAVLPGNAHPEKSMTTHQRNARKTLRHCCYGDYPHMYTHTQRTVKLCLNEVSYARSR